MKLLLVVALVAACAALPQKDAPAFIVEQKNSNDGLGTYEFGFKTSDGLSRQETGEVKNAGSENEAMESRGSISWTDAEGKERTLTFVANEDGFQPKLSR